MLSRTVVTSSPSETMPPSAWATAKGPGKTQLGQWASRLAASQRASRMAKPRMRRKNSVIAQLLAQEPVHLRPELLLDAAGELRDLLVLDGAGTRQVHLE